MSATTGLTLEQAQEQVKTLKSQGKTESNSKQVGKLVDYIKTLKPEKYGAESVAAAQNSLKLKNEPVVSGVPATTGTGAISASSISSPDELTSYLDSYQSGIFNSKDSVALRDSITKQLEPETAKPEVLNRAAEYDKMRQQYGVADLEKNLTDLKTALETEVATTRQRTQKSEGGQVAMGVIAGRVGEIERQQNERVDVINRQINTMTDQLNTAYNTISTYMNFMGQDYQDAVNSYNTDFNRNLQIYNLVDSELDEQVAAARANLQTYQNAILAGNISYDSLPSSQKSFLSKLEVQSGLPIGFTASLKPEEKVLYSGTRDSGGVKYLDMIVKGAAGQPMTKTISLGGTSSGTGEGTVTERQAKDKKNAQNLMMGDFKEITSQKDGYTSPAQYKQKADEWVSAGFDIEDFYSFTRNKVNPTHYTDYGIPKKYITED